MTGVVKGELWCLTLREKSLSREFFLVRIFLYLDWMQENKDQKKLRIWTLSVFTQCDSNNRIRNVKMVILSNNLEAEQIDISK